ncbi:acetyltransferase [bacterium]|nr:acetyltransferase [bacterium]
MIEIPKQCFILGAGGQCRVVISILSEYKNKYQIAGILDTGIPDLNETILGFNVIGGLNELQSLFRQGCQVAFIAIGDNRKRSEYFNLLNEKSFKLPNLVSLNASIDSTVTMGQANIVCSMAHIGPGVKIGDNNLINTGAILDHESILQDHCHLAPGSILCGRSQLGTNVFVGAGTTIINKIKISSDQTIGAGAVVAKDIDSPVGVYAGVPARLLS